MGFFFDKKKQTFFKKKKISLQETQGKISLQETHLPLRQIAAEIRRKNHLSSYFRSNLPERHMMCVRFTSFISLLCIIDLE